MGHRGLQPHTAEGTVPLAWGQRQRSAGDLTRVLRSPLVPSAVRVSQREALPQHPPVTCPKEVPRCHGAGPCSHSAFHRQKVCTALCGSRGGTLPGTQGIQTLPKLQRTNFPGIPGPLRSEETLPGSSRDQRGAQCQGLMPPPPPPPPSPAAPHPGELSPPAQRPAVLHKRFGEKGLKETLQNTDVRMALGLSSHSGGGGCAPALAEPPAAAAEAASAWLIPLAAPSVMLCLLCQTSPAADRDRPGLSPHPEPRPPHLQGGPSPESRVRSPRGAGDVTRGTAGSGWHLAVRDLGEVSSLATLQPRKEHHSTKTLCIARAAGRAGTTRQTNPDLGPHSFITVTSNTQALRSSTWTHRKRGLGAGRQHETERWVPRAGRGEEERDPAHLGSLGLAGEARWSRRSPVLPCIPDRAPQDAQGRDERGVTPQSGFTHSPIGP